MRLALLCLFFLNACASSKKPTSTAYVQAPKEATQPPNTSNEVSTDTSNSRSPALPDKVVSHDEELELAIAPFLADAKRSYPGARDRYLAGLPTGHVFMVATRLSGKHGNFEQVFVRVTSIKTGKVHGTISNEVNRIEGYRFGDAVELSEEEIRDWVILKPDGSEEGNGTGRFLDYWGSGEFYGALFGITLSSSKEASIRYLHMLDRNNQGAKMHFDPPSIFLQAARDELKGRSWQKAELDKEFFTYLLFWPLDPTNVSREP